MPRPSLPKTNSPYATLRRPAPSRPSVKRKIENGICRAYASVISTITREGKIFARYDCHSFFKRF